MTGIGHIMRDSKSPIARTGDDRPRSPEDAPAPSWLPWLPWLVCGWTLPYAAYRTYYALGGTAGMFGTPVSRDQWRFINGVAALLLVLTAALAALSPLLRKSPRARAIFTGVGWLIAVGCVMHALVDEATRVLSLAGVVYLEYPVFAVIDRRAADLQDIFLNEPWFFVEGLLWGTLCWSALRSAAARRRFAASAAVAIALLTIVGILSSTGIIGRYIVG